MIQKDNGIAGIKNYLNALTSKNKEIENSEQNEIAQYAAQLKNHEKIIEKMVTKTTKKQTKKAPVATKKVEKKVVSKPTLKKTTPTPTTKKTPSKPVKKTTSKKVEMSAEKKVVDRAIKEVKKATATTKKAPTKKKIPVKKTKTYKNATPETSFYVCTGNVLNNPSQLAQVIEELNDEAFARHVNEAKNDFANWIEFVFNDKKLADQLRKAPTKIEHVKIIKTYI